MQDRIRLARTEPSVFLGILLAKNKFNFSKTNKGEH